MELISRDEVAERLEIVINHGIPSENGLHLISAESVLETIKELPIIEERKEGHWIPYLPEYEDMFKCSECKEIVRLPFKAIQMPYKYCPYCGARIKGE